jgi:hypothetical protein
MIKYFSRFLQEVYEGHKISRAHVHVKNDGLTPAYIPEIRLVEKLSVICELCTYVEAASVCREI